jgi:hypothetical protein
MRMHAAARLPALLTSAAVIALACVPLGAAADTGSEGSFISATSAARSSHGLRRYAVTADLTAVARRWAAHMAARRRLEHNPGYGSEVCCWTHIGENVGEGASVAQIQRAFMSSPEHRANILSSSFTQIGIGTARSSDGRLWVDEIFRRPTSSAPRTPQQPSRVTTATRHPAVRYVPPRVSRSAIRRPPHAARAARVTDTLLLEGRLAVARTDVHPPYADPVAGAVAYLQVMRQVAGSARH